MIAMNMKKPSRSYHCATCDKTSEYTGSLPDLYPFCSERCKMVDLGRWFNNEYSIETTFDPDVMTDLPKHEE
ncbi:MAG: DNA gyrase inhibitor YacG [Phycisphaerae bacterium]